MGGDFSRDSFDPRQHFSRVLTQQGRVQLDADANEQTAILLHYLRTLAADLVGPHAGPRQNCGFQISLAEQEDKSPDLRIGSGHYYVDGLLCEHEVAQGPRRVEQVEPVLRPAKRRAGDERALRLPSMPTISYFEQPDLPLDRQQDRLSKELTYLVYLDVWERELTALEAPAIRDPALGSGGPDTAARAKVVWQVRTTSRIPPAFTRTGEDAKIWESFNDDWADWVKDHHPPQRGLLEAKGRDDQPDETDVCIVDPGSRYRGAENQLYRVEIHSGGPAGVATFKWSRDNGAIVFPLQSPPAQVITLGSLGRDAASNLEVGDWVELVDDAAALRLHDTGRVPGPLYQIDAIEPLDQQITLAKAPDGLVARDQDLHPLLRRWDQQAGDTRRGYPNIGEDGALKLEENKWLTLEDGVQIRFLSATGQDSHQYRSGDYWLIPARVATGDVLWPQLPADPAAKEAQGDARPAALPPHGVEHHYAPLALVIDGNRVVDLRSHFKPLIERSER
ncbi:MAG: hypothetical protein OHK0022_31680 [Roseiflexaceae bacterium]